MSSSTPTSTDEASCDIHFTFIDCGGLPVTIVLSVLFLSCYARVLWFALRYIVLYVCGTLRAIHAALFGRALDVQPDSIEDDRAHGKSEMMLPLVFCETWMRPPLPTKETTNVGQSEWPNVQPISVFVSSQVACKSAPGVSTSGSAVSAYASTWTPPNDSKFSSPIVNLSEVATIAVMIQMPTPVLRCLKDRKCLSCNPAGPDNALPEYQIGVAQVRYVDTRC